MACSEVDPTGIHHSNANADTPACQTPALTGVPTLNTNQPNQNQKTKHMNQIVNYTHEHEPHLSSSPPREALDTSPPGLAASPPNANCQLIIEHPDWDYLAKVYRFLSGNQPTPGWVWKRSDTDEDLLGCFKVLAQSSFTPIHTANPAPNTHSDYRMTCFARVGNEGEPVCGPGGELTKLLDRFPDLKISGRVESATGAGTIHGFELTPNATVSTAEDNARLERSLKWEHLSKLSNQQLETLIEGIAAEGAKTPEEEQELLAAAELMVERTGIVTFHKLGVLSIKLAKVLARVGDCLEITSIDDYEEGAFRHLAKCPGELDLLDPSWLLETAVGELGDRVGVLALDGITALSLPAARALSEHRGLLQLDSILGAPPEVIRVLGQHKGTTILANLCDIPDSAADGFAFHVGDLVLNGLTQISPHLAECLATNDGALYLSGLTTLSAEIAEALSHHCGELQLRGLLSLSDEACKHLGRHEGNLIFGRELNHVSVHGLKALAANRGDLHLDGLKTLCPEGAAALAKHRGALHLGGLTGLDPGNAEILSSHAGPLSFSGVPNLCPAAARALSRHRGELRLKGLQALGYPASGFLESHSGPVYLGKALKDSRDFAVHWSCR